MAVPPFLPRRQIPPVALRPAPAHRLRRQTSRSGSRQITTKRKSARAARPAYVNPNIGNYLDVWVDGSHVIAPAAGFPNVVASPDGTQTFTLPIYSTSSHNVVAIESDCALNTCDLLALGEADIANGSFSPGDTFAVGLTMQMNVVYVGHTNPNQGLRRSARGAPQKQAFCIGAGSLCMARRVSVWCEDPPVPGP